MQSDMTLVLILVSESILICLMWLLSFSSCCMYSKMYVIVLNLFLPHPFNYIFTIFSFLHGSSLKRCFTSNHHDRHQIYCSVKKVHVMTRSCNSFPYFQYLSLIFRIFTEKINTVAALESENMMGVANLYSN